MLKGFFYLHLSLLIDPLLIASSPNAVGYRVVFKDVYKLHSWLYRRTGFGKLSWQAHRNREKIEMCLYFYGQARPAFWPFFLQLGLNARPFWITLAICVLFHFVLNFTLMCKLYVLLSK